MPTPVSLRCIEAKLTLRTARKGRGGGGCTVDRAADGYQRARKVNARERDISRTLVRTMAPAMDEFDAHAFLEAANAQISGSRG
jgi:hypothetical protein